MSRPDRSAGITDADLCEFGKRLENETGIRIQFALVPLARTSGKSTHAVTATAYFPTGKRVLELEREQVYFPGQASRTFAGAAFYVGQQLAGKIDEWQARKTRQEEEWPQGRLTALEEYIAGSS